MRLMSISTFQASSTGSGTSNELSNSMIATPTGSAPRPPDPELIPNPLRYCEQPRVLVARPDQLNSDRQAVGADRRRQRHRRRVQQRPYRLKGRVAGVMEALRRLAAHAGREQ